MHELKRVVIFCTCLIAGCATAPTAGPNAFVERLAAEGTAAIYVGRPYAPSVSVVPLILEVDGKPFVTLGMNQYTRIELPPGVYTFAAADSYLTLISFGKPVPQQITISTNKKYFIVPRTIDG